MSVSFQRKDRYTMEDLQKIVELLRGKDGCPWDREQDHHSIRKNFLEETYEAVEAIDKEDPVLLREELGDVLLQVVFHAQMEKEKGIFDLSDVCHDICQKLVERHPHVFGEVEADTTEQVLANWEEIKKRQKGQASAVQALQSVPVTFPALMRAEKLQHRGEKNGLYQPELSQEMEKAEAAVRGLQRAAEQNGEQPEDIVGDLLFSIVNISRFLSIDPEQSLTKACERFICRCEEQEAQRP